MSFAQSNYRPCKVEMLVWHIISSAELDCFMDISPICKSYKRLLSKSVSLVLRIHLHLPSWISQDVVATSHSPCYLSSYRTSSTRSCRLCTKPVVGQSCFPSIFCLSLQITTFCFSGKCSQCQNSVTKQCFSKQIIGQFCS